MIPVHELLNRIRWDAEFGKGRLELGYHDRNHDDLQWVAFREIAFPPDGGQEFEVEDELGRTRRIPFHRVREVSRDGQVIWRRPPGSLGNKTSLS